MLGGNSLDIGVIHQRGFFRLGPGPVWQSKGDDGDVLLFAEQTAKSLAWPRLVRFPNPLALGSGLGLQYPYRRVFFLSALPAQKNVNQIWAMGCLLDSSTSQLSSCPITSFFYSLVTALALDFFPPPDCNFFLPPIATFTV